MSDVPSIAVVCEGPSDRAVIELLGDRVLASHVDWFTAATANDLRRWRGQHDGEACILWRSLAKRREGTRLRGIFGKFNGEVGAPDAFATRLVLLLLLEDADSVPDAVVLLRDADGPATREGMKQACAARTWPFPIVASVAIAKLECWKLAAFVADSEAEHERIESALRDLGHPPCRDAHLLIARTPGSKNETKRVLDRLADGDHARGLHALETRELDELEACGERVGLAAFVRDLRATLPPLLGAPPPAPSPL